MSFAVKYEVCWIIESYWNFNLQKWFSFSIIFHELYGHASYMFPNSMNWRVIWKIMANTVDIESHS